MVDRTLRFPSFNRPKRKDDAYYAGQLAYLEKYEGKDLSPRKLLSVQEREFGAPVRKINGHELKQMSRKDFVKFAGLTGLVAGAAAVMSGKIVPNVQAPSAPSVGWNVDSGSLVNGMTYCVYADPSGPTYLGRNGLTGKNDFSRSNPATLMNTDIWPALITAVRGGWVHVKAADYPMGTASPAVTFGEGNFTFSGEGGMPDYSAAPDIISLPTTRFLMGANNQTLFQGTATKVKNLLGVVIRDIDIETNAFTGGVPIDLTATTNLSSAGTRLERIYLNNILNDRITYSGSFATGLILDGCADMVISQIIDGLSRTGGTSTVCTNADVQFNHPSGDLTIEDSVLISTVSILGVWQFLNVLRGSYATVKLTQSMSNPGFTRFNGCYLGPSTSSPGDIFQANAFAADLLEFDNCWIRPGKNTGGAATRVVFLNGGTLDSLIFNGSQIDKFSTNTISITDSAANCGRRRALAISTRTTGAFTSTSPYTLDVNNYLTENA